MYRLVALERHHPLAGGFVRVLVQWFERPSQKLVQEVVDNFGANQRWWLGSYCGQKPPTTAMFAIWFELEWLDPNTGLWHTTFPKQDWLFDEVNGV